MTSQTTFFGAWYVLTNELDTLVKLIRKMSYYVLRPNYGYERSTRCKLIAAHNPANQITACLWKFLFSIIKKSPFSVMLTRRLQLSYMQCPCERVMQIELSVFQCPVNLVLSFPGGSDGKWRYFAFWWNISSGQEYCCNFIACLYFIVTRLL